MNNDGMVRVMMVVVAVVVGVVVEVVAVVREVVVSVSVQETPQTFALWDSARVCFAPFCLR